MYLIKNKSGLEHLLHITILII